MTLRARCAVLLRPEAVCIAARDALERALRAAGEVRGRRDRRRVEEAAAAVFADHESTDRPDHHAAARLE